jgi:hypothetical protein
LVGAAVDRGAQLGRELALLVDALEHRRAPLLELAQVAQARLELAQLRVVEAVGGLLAVAGDEGNVRPAVEQFERPRHLRRPNLQPAAICNRIFPMGLGRGAACFGRLAVYQRVGCPVSTKRAAMPTMHGRERVAHAATPRARRRLARRSDEARSACAARLYWYIQVSVSGCRRS